jgi:hypothetical protein
MVAALMLALGITQVFYTPYSKMGVYNGHDIIIYKAVNLLS